MKINRFDQGGEIKTMNSQQSDIDLFSKLEVGFLQKYFKYNINDQFSDILLNVYEDLLNRKAANKIEKSLASSFFITAKGFIIEEFQKRIQKYYSSKSKSITEGHLPYAFKLKYCSLNPAPNLIKPKQLVLMEVKIRADVQKIEELPQKILANLFPLKNKKKQKKMTQLQKILSAYHQEYFTIFVIYFGDANFNIFHKNKYQVENITILGNTYKVRIFVFYVSKQALIECFKTVNKISNLEYINDLVIQFYELKRQKNKRKRDREQIKHNQNSDKHYQEWIYKIVGLCGLVTFGFVLKKILI